jgi:hypothetical protein
MRGPKPALVVNLLHLAASHTLRDKSIKPSLEPNKRLRPMLLSPIFRLSAMDECMAIEQQRRRGHRDKSCFIPTKQTRPTATSFISGYPLEQNSIPAFAPPHYYLIFRFLLIDR